MWQLKIQTLQKCSDFVQLDFSPITTYYDYIWFTPRKSDKYDVHSDYAYANEYFFSNVLQQDHLYRATRDGLLDTKISTSFFYNSSCILSIHVSANIYDTCLLNYIPKAYRLIAKRNLRIIIGNRVAKTKQQKQRPRQGKLSLSQIVSRILNKI